jgi:uncharacterized integral membrane protein
MFIFTQCPLYFLSMSTHIHTLSPLTHKNNCGLRSLETKALTFVVCILHHVAFGEEEDVEVSTCFFGIQGSCI